MRPGCLCGDGSAEPPALSVVEGNGAGGPSLSKNLASQKSYNVGADSAMAQSEIIFNIEESPEGGYEARALGFSIFTQADSLEELKAMIRDAVSCHFEDADKPRVIRLHMVKDEVIPA